MGPTLIQSRAECGFSDAHWESFLSALKTRLAAPANQVGLEGVRRHRERWETWLETFMDDEIGPQFWRASLNQKWIFPKDKIIIREFLRVLIRMMASRVKIEISKGQTSGNEDSTGEGSGIVNDKNLIKDEGSVKRGLIKDGDPYRNLNAANEAEGSPSEIKAEKMRLKKSKKEEILVSQSKPVVSFSGGPSRATGTGGEKRKLADFNHDNQPQLPQMGNKAGLTKPDLYQEKAKSTPESKHVKSSAEPNVQESLENSGRANVNANSSVRTILDQTSNTILGTTSPANGIDKNDNETRPMFKHIKSAGEFNSQRILEGSGPINTNNDHLARATLLEHMPNPHLHPPSIFGPKYTPRSFTRLREFNGQGDLGQSRSINTNRGDAMPLDRTPNPHIAPISTAIVPPSFTHTRPGFICNTQIRTPQGTEPKHKLICGVECPSLSLFLSYARIKHKLGSDKKIISLQVRVGRRIDIDLNDPDKNLEWSIVLELNKGLEDIMSVILEVA